MTTRALPGLLVLTLAACGGRYSETGESSNGGKASSPSGQAGRSSGSGGAGAGGSGVAMGGVGVGVGGAPVASAGMATGAGGGAPIDTRASCQAYCEAFAKVCPDRDPYPCSKTCYSEQVGSPCPETLREAYDCITSRLATASDCANAQALSTKCGAGVDGWPLDCDDVKCERSVTADADSCLALMTCGNAQADL
jgi:hypothetical protein